MSLTDRIRAGQTARRATVSASSDLAASPVTPAHSHTGTAVVCVPLLDGFVHHPCPDPSSLVNGVLVGDNHVCGATPWLSRWRRWTVEHENVKVTR